MQQDEKNSPQRADPHRCKNSINGGSLTLAPEAWFRRPLSTDAPPPRSSPLSSCSRLWRTGSAGSAGSGDRGRPRACHRSATGELFGPDTLHARRHPLARLRKRHVPHALARGALERMAAGSAGGRGRPGPRLSREPGTERLAARKPVVGRAVRPDRGAHERAGRASSRAARMEPGAPRSLPDSGCDGDPGDRAARFLGSGRVDQARASAVRATGALLGRPSHRRPERLLPRRGRGDREGHPALPRQGKRLERHRLQLPRRPLRHGVRRPVRRSRAQRDRRACAGVQHRVGRSRAPRDVREHCSFERRAGGDRPAARLAPRSRSCRSDCGADVRLGREQSLPERCAGASARGFRPQGHRLHGVPRETSCTRA